MTDLIARYHGLVPYDSAITIQKELHKSVSEGGPDQLILLQHPHVFTMGRRAKDQDVLIDQENLANYGIRIHRSDRGGEVTYHGPGQLVGYPIINLRRAGNMGPLTYVNKLQETISNMLSNYGISSETEGRPTGVWVNSKKIASIGVRISNGTSSHGFALNVTTDLSYFEHIIACGMPDAIATSISAQTKQSVSMEEVICSTANSLSHIFGTKLLWNESQNR